MKRLLIIALMLSMVHGGTAYAQLGGLKNLAKKALDEAVKDDSKKSDESKSDDNKKADNKSLGGVLSSGGEGRSRPSARKDPNRKYPPGLSFSTVLNGVKLLAKKGMFTLHHIQATFVPDDSKGGFVVLRTADNKEIFQFDWRPDRLKKPYTLLNIYKNIDLINNKDKGTGYVDLTTPGKYVLDFYLTDEHFYTFPFSVAKIGNDDPFGGGDCYIINGDWENYGYLYYVKADASQSLFWKIWLRNKAPEPVDVKIRIEITRDADGKLVCQNREGTTYKLTPEWIRYEFDMIFPPKGTSGGAYFKAKDLLATDGGYTLTMKINDKPYGVWKFAVKDKKLNYTGRTLRGKADPRTFIEGGRDAWWYEKQKPKAEKEEKKEEKKAEN